MGFMFLVVITLVVAILILNGVELEQITDGVSKVLGQLFPRLNQATTEVNDDL